MNTRVRARRIVLPPWAAKIEVERRGDDLIVTGTDVFFSPQADYENYEGFKDFLGTFYSSRRLAKRIENRGLPHVIFRHATSDDALIDFVRSFGPVLAHRFEDVIPIAFDTGIPTVAVQSLPILRAEQRVFARVHDLICRLIELDSFCGAVFQLDRQFAGIVARDFDDERDQKVPERRTTGQRERAEQEYYARRTSLLASKRDDLNRVGSLIAQLRADLREAVSRRIPTEIPTEPWEGVILASEEDAAAGAYEGGLSGVHKMLCEILNLFPPALVYSGGYVSEEPIIRPWGIRSALYFMLRSEYLYKRQIKMCKRPDCGRFFIPDRADTVFCEDACSDKYRQRKHYRANKSKRLTV